MVNACVFFNCTQRYSKGIKFHSFPKQPKLKEKWIKAVGRKDFIPNTYSRICGKHFKDENYHQNHMGNKILNLDAVPFQETLLPEEVGLEKAPESIKVENHYFDGEEAACNSTFPLQSFEDTLCEPENSKEPEFAKAEESVDLEEAEEENEEDDQNNLFGQRKRRRLDPVYVKDFTEQQLECPRLRKNYWLASQKVIADYRNKFKAMNRKINSLNALVDSLKMQIKLSSSEASIF